MSKPPEQTKHNLYPAIQIEATANGYIVRPAPTFQNGGRVTSYAEVYVFNDLPAVYGWLRKHFPHAESANVGSRDYQH